MATIKSYSDLSQSKTLSKILPLESADMYYWLAWSGGVSEEKRNTPKVGTPNKDALRTYWCPCWSLTALLGVLPEKYTELIKEGGMYRIIIKDSYMTCLFDNPVDACVAMVENLNKLNLL